MPAQNPEDANSRGIAKHSRYGGSLGTYRIHRRDIVANETVPTDVRAAAVVGDRYEECRWVIQMPPTITAFSIHFLRWVVVLKPTGEEVIPGFYVEEEVVNATESLVVDQFVNGDRLACYIDNTTGNFGSGFVILRKGVNKHS